jgi:hypothetical protein
MDFEVARTPERGAARRPNTPFGRVHALKNRRRDDLLWPPA